MLLALLVTASAAPVLAHSGLAGDGPSGFVAGFVHPLLGGDPIVAMVAVGLWGAFLGRPAIWLLPVVFALVMTVGGALGVLGVPLPATKIGMALSAVLLGALVAAAARLPIGLAGVIVCVFAVFHGHAHGTELPGAANPLVYSFGFVFATGLLHLAGVALGVAVRWQVGSVAVRVAGGAIAAAGLLFLRGAL